ncbi:hypothetical protein ACNKHU_17075 [Shigella flexneri]
MMSRLNEHLARSCASNLSGDRNQLASVEAGAVLGDICAYANAGLPPSVQAAKPPDGNSRSGRNWHRSGIFRDSLCLLQKSYRFGSDSGIGQLAAAINRGDKTAVKPFSSWILLI